MSAVLSILFLSVLVTQEAHGVLDPEHLCHKVMTGRFEAIYIRSITYYGPKRLWLFESERKYNVNRTTEMGPEATTLPVANFTAWNAEQMAFVDDPVFWAFTKRAIPTPKAVYLLGYANPDRYYGMHRVRNFLAKECLLAVLVGEHEEMIWDVWWNVISKPHLKWKSEGGRVHPDFAIVADQLNDHPEGYVVHQDIYGNTRNFILYDLVVERSFGFSYNFFTVALHIQRLKAPAKERATAHYFYLEKNERPDQVLLVHRTNFKAKQAGEAQSDAELKAEMMRQLLPPSSHPVGYKNGENTFLFDNLLGCVYIIHRLPASLEALYKKYEGNPAAAEMTFSRTNVPYEEFFRCDVEYFKMKDLEKVLDPKRCETTMHTESFKADSGEVWCPSCNEYGKKITRRNMAVAVGIGAALFLFATLLLTYCCCWEAVVGKAAAEGGKNASATTKKNSGGKWIRSPLYMAEKMKKRKRKTPATPKSSTTAAPSATTSSAAAGANSSTPPPPPSTTTSTVKTE